MKEIIATDRAPQAIGPYSQAVRAGGFLFCSGQIPLDPATGETCGAETGEQTEQVMDNIAGVLAAAGLGFDAVVKTTIYLVDLADFSRGKRSLRQEVYVGSAGSIHRRGEGTAERSEGGN